MVTECDDESSLRRRRGHRVAVVRCRPCGRSAEKRKRRERERERKRRLGLCFERAVKEEGEGRVFLFLFSFLIQKLTNKFEKKLKFKAQWALTRGNGV